MLQRVAIGGFARPDYAYCAYRAAELAHRLGLEEVTWVEFGVASGNGLLALEQIKTAVKKQFPIEVHIVGFDLGSGLPTPLDYRDMPYHWQGGFYRMDVEALEAKLSSARLVLGPVEDTLADWTPPAPIGMISFDLDYYSSTAQALNVFDLEVLPRVFSYFDDVTGVGECHSDFTGARLAVAQYNEKHETRKLSACYDFQLFGLDRWQQKVMIHHDFHHPRYNDFVGLREYSQIPLTG